jgi:hypothetical protein
MTSESLVNTLHIDCGHFNECVVDSTSLYIHKNHTLMKSTEENNEKLHSTNKWDVHMSSKNSEKNGFSLNLDSICLPSLIMCLVA